MTLKSVSAGLAWVCERIAASMFLWVCLLNIAQVLGRYVIGTSIPWAEEAMRYTMVWVMMLGGSAAVFHVEHMAVDGLVDMLAPNRRHVVLSVLYAIAGGFCVLLVLYGWPAAMANIRQHAAASGISMMWPYLGIPVGAAIMIVQIVLCILSGFNEINSEPERL